MAMMVLTDNDKAALRAHTKELAKTYDEIKGVFAHMAPAAARVACETYEWFKTTRPNLVEQQRQFQAMRDAAFKIDREAADLYDLAMATNKKTLELIDTIVKRAKEHTA